MELPSAGHNCVGCKEQVYITRYDLSMVMPCSYASALFFSKTTQFFLIFYTP